MVSTSIHICWLRCMLTAKNCHSVARIEERSILNQIVEKALECNSCLMRIAEFALSCHDRDLSILAGKLIIPLKVMFYLILCLYN